MARIFTGNYKPLDLEYQRWPKNKMPICGFFGPYRFLSNFFLHPVLIDGVTLASGEHAFVWFKSESSWFRDQVLRTTHPRDVKKLGRAVRLRSDWDASKNEFMHRVLLAKYADLDMWTRLQSTQYRYLEETNTWNDTYWGKCGAHGLNHLGRLTMCVRHSTRRA